MGNRAGLMKNAEHSMAPLEKTPKKPCFPLYTFLDYNGDVLMYPHD